MKYDTTSRKYETSYREELFERFLGDLKFVFIQPMYMIIHIINSMSSETRA